ncbi:hypothetical protein PSHT_11701 [Puccinia striiformis]|uniref:HAT C-terminal dimerisation domain-containing protein n=1 Tax=Puccinia striiformis TaxID=27350 RepID=A0A2S4V1N7_9BASI|nr:hypothetical protein PSHT_11701 [Puccinia striiformis]
MADGFKLHKRYGFYVLVMVAGWILPPIAVLLRFGFGTDFLLNIVLTLCGYIPGHGHNFYLQNIRNNENRKRTPKWATKAGLVKDNTAKRKAKTQWANRYDERTPTRADGYQDDDEQPTVPGFTGGKPGPGTEEACYLNPKDLWRVLARRILAKTLLSRVLVRMTVKLPILPTHSRESSTDPYQPQNPSKISRRKTSQTIHNTSNHSNNDDQDPYFIRRASSIHVPPSSSSSSSFHPRHSKHGSLGDKPTTPKSFSQKLGFGGPKKSQKKNRFDVSNEARNQWENLPQQHRQSDLDSSHHSSTTGGNRAHEDAMNHQLTLQKHPFSLSLFTTYLAFFFPSSPSSCRPSTTTTTNDRQLPPHTQEKTMNEANQPQAERPHQERTKPLSWVWAYFKPTEIGGVRYNVCHAPISPGSNELCLKRMIPDKSTSTHADHSLTRSTLKLWNRFIKERLNRDTLMTGITKFLIANNLPSQTIDNQQFIELLHLCNPLITRPLLFDPDTLTQFIPTQIHNRKTSTQRAPSQLTTTTKLSFSCTRYSPSDRNHSLIALVERIFSLTIDNSVDRLHGISDQSICRISPQRLLPPQLHILVPSDIHDTVDNNTTAPHTVHVSSILSRLQDLTLFLRQSSQKNESFNRISLSHQEAIQIFCLKEVGAAQFNIHDQEWDLVRQICDFLKPMNIAANEISADKPCDMITATPTFCWLLRRLNKVRKNYEGRELMEPIKEMLERLTVYQEITITTPPRPIPRPTTKDRQSESKNQTIKQIQLLITTTSPPSSSHHHHKRSRNQQSNQASESDSDSDYESGKPRIFKKKPKLMIGLKDEITNYLGTDCEESNCNPLEFWKSNSSKFPTLFGMSKDFLQVQASTGSALNICEKFHLLSEAFLSGGSSTSFSLNPNNHPPPTHNTNSNKHLHSRDMSNPGHFMNLPTNSSQTTGTTPHNNNISTDSMFGIHPQIAGGTPSSSSSQPPPSSTTTNNQSSARSNNGYNQSGYGLSFQPSIPTIEKDIIVHPPPSSSSNIPIDPSIPTTVTSISTPVPPTSNNNNPPLLLLIFLS